MAADCHVNCWSLEVQRSTNWACVAVLWEHFICCCCVRRCNTILHVGWQEWDLTTLIIARTGARPQVFLHYWENIRTREREEEQSRARLSLLTNEWLRRRWKWDHFSPVIISVSLMLLGKKNGCRDALRGECHFHTGTKSIKVTATEMERCTERGNQPH